MTTVNHFFLHTLMGRITLIALFLFVSLLFASVLGWLPELF